MTTWTELKPLAVRARWPQIGVSATIMGKQRSAVAYVTFNHELCLELGLDGVTDTTARVDIGSGDRAGWMKVSPSTGHHKLSATGPKGQNKALRLVLRLPAPLSQKIDLTHINDFTTQKGSSDGIGSVEFEMPAFLDAMFSDNVQVEPDETVSEEPPPPKAPKVKKIKLRPWPRPVPPRVSPAVVQPLFGLDGRFFRVQGKPPITLQADEINLVKMLIIRSGDVLTKSEAEKLEPMPHVPIARLNKRLEAYRVCIEERRGGWALVSRAAA